MLFRSVDTAAQLFVAGAVIGCAAIRADHDVVSQRQRGAAALTRAAIILRHTGKPPGFVKLIAIILSAQGKEKVKIFKIPARQLFFLFTLPQIVGILVKYLCIKYKLLPGAALLPGEG